MTKLFAFCAPLVLTGMLAAGCDANPAAPLTAAAIKPVASSGENGTDSHASSGGASSTSKQIGETCTAGDANKQCLAVHFVAYRDTSGAPTATESDAARIISTMNRIWAQCDIGFQVETYDSVDPTDYGLSYGAQSQNEVDTIRYDFEKPSNQLLAVTTGPWGTAVNAWTNMPGAGIYGAVMEASIVNYGAGIIYAHEFGHYLGLNHVGDSSELMNPIIYTNSTKITSSQCATARATVNGYWSDMLRH